MLQQNKLKRSSNPFCFTRSLLPWRWPFCFEEISIWFQWTGPFYFISDWFQPPGCLWSLRQGRGYISFTNCPRWPQVLGAIFGKELLFWLQSATTQIFIDNNNDLIKEIKDSCILKIKPSRCYILKFYEFYEVFITLFVTFHSA